MNTMQDESELTHESTKGLPAPSQAAYVTRASIFDRLKSNRAGDWEMAWTDFRAKYAPIIAGFAKRCGASRQDIDDIVQDVLTSFFSVSDAFQYDPAKGRFRGWLKTCTVRSAVRRAGKNLRFNGQPLADVPQVELAVDEMWNDVWEKELVAQALSIVRKETAGSVTFLAFEQYVLQDRPAETVAEELGVSVATVYQAKTRITKQLRESVARIRDSEL